MHCPIPPVRPSCRAIRLSLGLALAAGLLVACDAGGAPATPPITPGTGTAPREVNIVARDYAFVPTVVDLVPGETVVLHVVNAGLVVHEAIVGDLDAQLAWEEAERPYADPPPGPTPAVPVPSAFDGTRVVVESGQRMDVTWTVPVDAASDPSGWFVGCHIPGHWAKGMVVPVRLVDGSGAPLASTPPIPGTATGG